MGVVQKVSLTIRWIQKAAQKKVRAKANLWAKLKRVPLTMWKSKRPMLHQRKNYLLENRSVYCIGVDFIYDVCTVEAESCVFLPSYKMCRYFCSNAECVCLNCASFSVGRSEDRYC